MLKVKDKVVIINPESNRKQMFKDQKASIVEVRCRLLSGVEYKLQFEDADLQKWNSICMFRFTDRELTKIK